MADIRALLKRNPGGRAGASGSLPGRQSFHVQSATAEPLLQRLEGVQKSGNGWRARCPSCGGRSRKVSVTERDGRVLVYCFGGCEAIAVLEAVGLGWPDVMPPRTWPLSPADRERARQAMREVGIVSAIDALAVEATVVLLASRQLYAHTPLTPDDDDRLMLACHRIEHAAHALTKKDEWRPRSAYSEAGLVTVTRGAVRLLRRELEAAERELESAEAAMVATKRRAAEGEVRQ